MKRADWIKVEDRLPVDGDIVLIRCPHVTEHGISDLYYVGYYIIELKQWVGDGLYNDIPTHWMSIVSPQKND